MNFYKWVNSLAITNTPEGDLVRDIQADNNFPKNINSLEELLNYLPYDERIQEIAKTLFESYLADKHRHK
ncbi:YozE family protein [Lactobacillus johnsonii]|uniref:YozE SAM-like domain-containing protein n=1 Tax=Lactobacillus johnsonii TaxID=33959 RepID=A0A9X6RW71_LACJH|nr:YozE family protein [Lactobacillus johnsonii]OYS01759.1 hypothetical protein CBF54_08305 [Lactobacillus johnsonii]OYS07073.1 hypothetical protein CBF65_07870 [Lactobacillus johnsonii]OYS07728.1 hypothetical protein CBF62_04915 [Lactobacillus johnsonii]OYS10427.1 hypothetical protein CBF50_08960 [Lactobacillus johnsonii]OYS11196.1 hypothetical protein CBF63_01150 [Lactobacillus johnsonii]